MSSSSRYLRNADSERRCSGTVAEVPVPEVAAAMRGGVFTGTKRLKIKESDRAAAMARELQKLGTSVTVYEDKVIVYPRELHAPSEALCGHNDHRIVMALAILLTLVGGEIEGADAVSKSYPEFFSHLRSLGIGAYEYES